jgi:galactokinase
MEALEWIRQGETFDIALIDQQMPEMDGLQLAMEIRALRDVTPAMLEAEQKRLTGDELRRSRHVVTENARTIESVEALCERDADRFGRLMVASHESLRDDYEVSSKELDTLVELSLATPGVLGARLTGAGFGGCAIALASAEKAEAAAESIISTYRSRTGRGGSSFVTTASEGASIVAG